MRSRKKSNGIPACAGMTVFLENWLFNKSRHPRAGGDPIFLLLVLLFLTLAFHAVAQESLPDPGQEAHAVALGEELRCVVCQSESINESQADMARDMRLLVREKIAQGWSDQQILDFARARYGDFILLKPPVQANTYLLWALPILFLALAGGLAAGLFRRRSNFPAQD